MVEHTKFVHAFGDISTPLTEAIRATVEWYRAQESPALETEDGSEELELDEEVDGEEPDEPDQKSTE